MLHKVDIRSIARKAGLDLVGITPARPLLHLEEILRQRAAEGRITSFEEKDQFKRISPEQLLNGCRSIIVVGQPYPLAPDPLPLSREPRGLVARCARGFDYHQLLTEKGELLISLLKKELGRPFNYRLLVDRNPLVERELARMAGLGLVGENCSVITVDFGSHVALGTILVDLELETSEPLDKGCDSCGRCRKICPTGALIAPYTLNPTLCLSYLTQTPGIIPVKIRPLMGLRLYGCDSCQEVCPHNQQVAPPSGVSFTFFPAEPLLLPLLSITKKEFSQSIALSAAGWRGKTILQRNAVIALGNSENPEAVPDLTLLLKEDYRPVIRLHAAWALGRIGGRKVRQSLESALGREDNSQVRDELIASLK